MLWFVWSKLSHSNKRTRQVPMVRARNNGFHARPAMQAFRWTLKHRSLNHTGNEAGDYHGSPHFSVYPSLIFSLNFWPGDWAETRHYTFLLNTACATAYLFDSTHQSSPIVRIDIISIPVTYVTYQQSAIGMSQSIARRSTASHGCD